MVRNQVYFTEDQDRELKLMVAMGYGKYSELVREGVNKVIKDNKKTKTINNFDAWKDFIGAIKGGSEIDGVKAIQDYYMNDVV